MARQLHSGSNDLETIVFERRSIRGYKKQAVPREVLEDVIRIAQRAPSSMNTQPWHFHVLTGERDTRMKNSWPTTYSRVAPRTALSRHSWDSPSGECVPC